jgi:glycosyltransferase involved in cell wall biosynthesis
MGLVSDPRLSVVVPVKDPSGLEDCLRALAAQDLPSGSFEVVVVDNGAPAGVVADLARRYGCTAVDEPVPGSYRARNRGVAAARGEVLAFTDADCRPDGAWLARGLEALERGAGVVAGRVQVVAGDPARPHPVEAYEVMHAFPQPTYVARGGGSVTANMITTRAVFEAVGMFREDLRSGGDLEWSRRAHAAGHRTVYEPAAVVVHPARRTYAEVYRKLVRVHAGAAAVGGTDGRSALRVRPKDLVPPVGALRRARDPRLPSLQARGAYVAGSIFHRYAAVWAKVRLRTLGNPDGGTT